MNCLEHVFSGVLHCAADSGSPALVIDVHDGGLHARDRAVGVQIEYCSLAALETHDPHPHITGVDVQSGHSVPQGLQGQLEVVGPHGPGLVCHKDDVGLGRSTSSCDTIQLHHKM